MKEFELFEPPREGKVMDTTYPILPLSDIAMTGRFLDHVREEVIETLQKNNICAHELTDNEILHKIHEIENNKK